MARRKGFIYNQRFIDTLITLRGILPGDEIIMGPDSEHDTASDRERLVGRVLVVDTNGMYPNGTHEPWVCGADLPRAPAAEKLGTYLTRENIAAWRRPPKEKA